MKKIISYNAIFSFSLLLLLAVSCTPESCFEETNAYVKGTFYSTATGKAATPDSITMYGVDMSKVKLYNKATGVQPAYIPLNAGSGSSSFVIKINGIRDTVTFSYSSSPHLLSMECGYTFYHTLDTVFHTKNQIEDIIIKNENVTTLKEENIRIFY